jgi:hypothetical protein
MRSYPWAKLKAGEMKTALGNFAFIYHVNSYCLRE